MYRKDPREAAILGIVFVGLGHFYLGMWLKGIALILVTVIVTAVTSIYVAPVFWVISTVWAYYDAKSYNREAGYPENDEDEEEEVDSDEEEEEEETDSDEDEEQGIGSEEEEEETDSDEDEEQGIGSNETLKELRAIRSTMNVVAILLLVILGVMVYLLLHLTRFVLAP